MDNDLLNKLERLVQLKEQGVLTEAEFEVHKAELFRSKDASGPAVQTPIRQVSEAHKPVIRRPAFWMAVVVVSALFVYFVRQPSDENKRQAAQLKAQMLRDRMAEQADQKKASARKRILLTP